MRKGTSHSKESIEKMSVARQGMILMARLDNAIIYIEDKLNSSDDDFPVSMRVSLHDRLRELKEIRGYHV